MNLFETALKAGGDRLMVLWRWKGCEASVVAVFKARHHALKVES